MKFGDGEFACDVTQLYPGSHLDDEGYLITAKGEKLDLTDMEVNVEVGLQDIAMSDNPDEGGAKGHIISLIYKSEYYRYIVRTENEEDYVLACEDLWNENDLVSLVIPPDKIKLTLKNPEEKQIMTRAKLLFPAKLLAIPYGLFLALFVVIPLLIIVYYAFTDRSGNFTFDNFVNYFGSSGGLAGFFRSSVCKTIGRSFSSP